MDNNYINVNSSENNKSNNVGVLNHQIRILMIIRNLVLENLFWFHLLVEY